MIKFCQPNDYRYKGRNIWINPDDVVTVERAEGSTSESVITLRDGRTFTVQGNPGTIAEQLKQ